MGSRQTRLRGQFERQATRLRSQLSELARNAQRLEQVTAALDRLEHAGGAPTRQPAGLAGAAQGGRRHG